MKNNAPKRVLKIIQKRKRIIDTSKYFVFNHPAKRKNVKHETMTMSVNLMKENTFALTK